MMLRRCLPSCPHLSPTYKDKSPLYAGYNFLINSREFWHKCFYIGVNLVIMKNLFSFPTLDVVSDKVQTLHDFLKTSYQENKEWLAESIAFFKDLTQMEEEFRRELANKNEYRICLEGEMVSEKEVLSRPMEENY
jgi:hypothetical protein